MRKQLDIRIPILINNNVKKNHRSFIVLVGDKGRDQVCQVLVIVRPRSNFLLSQGRQSPFLTLASKGICQTFCPMVLQERTRLHDPSKEEGSKDQAGCEAGHSRAK